MMFSLPSRVGRKISCSVKESQGFRGIEVPCQDDPLGLVDLEDFVHSLMVALVPFSLLGKYAVITMRSRPSHVTSAAATLMSATLATIPMDARVAVPWIPVVGVEYAVSQVFPCQTAG